MNQLTPYSGYAFGQSFEMTSSQALNSVIDNVNNLIAILRDPSDTTTLHLPSSDYQRLTTYLSEASRALNKLSLDYNVVPSCLLPTGQAPISAPQTAHIVSSITVVKEVQPTVSSENIDVGTSFASLEEAEMAFKVYANTCGFNICKGNSKTDEYQEFACSARGKVRIRKCSDPAKYRNRKSIKKHCKCHIILRKKDDKWVVTTAKLQHTHDLMNNDQIKKTAKNRYIPDEVKQIAIDLYERGEPPAKIQYQFETEYGKDCTWTMKDLYNMLYRHRSVKKE